MSGSTLALFVTGALALAGVSRRGARAVNFFPADESGCLLGFRAMRFDPVKNVAISGADSRLSVSLVLGQTHRMPGKGMFLTNDPGYARMWYAGHDRNVLLHYSFDPSDVTSGSLEDREPEISVRQAVLVDWQVLPEEE